MARGAPDYASSRIPARAKLGYDSPVNEETTTVFVGAVTSLNSPAVPENKVWHLTQIAAWNNTSATPELTISTALLPFGMYPISYELNVPQRQGIYTIGEVWLEAGERIRAIFALATAGDDLYLSVHGTEIDVEV